MCFCVVYYWYVLRTRNTKENPSCLQHGPCDDAVKERDDKSGFGGTAESIMNERNCFIADEEQVSI